MIERLSFLLGRPFVDGVRVASAFSCEASNSLSEMLSGDSLNRSDAPAADCLDLARPSTVMA